MQVERKSQYCSNAIINDMITSAVTALQVQETPEGAEMWLKTAPTDIMAADASNEKPRHRPGNQLVTYKGVTSSGELDQETWGGGVATLEDDSVILRNQESLKFPDGHPKAGEEVHVTYADDGTATIVEEDEPGAEVARNEYASTMNFVCGPEEQRDGTHGAYGVVPVAGQFTGATKLNPSAVLTVPDGVGGVEIKDLHATGAGSATVGPGDVILIDTKRKVDDATGEITGIQITSVRGVAKEWLRQTYSPYAGGSPDLPGPQEV